jgi:hypothetical protein
MLVPSQLDHNRRSVPHTSNDCCVFRLPTFAGSVAKDHVAPKAVVTRSAISAWVQPF